MSQITSSLHGMWKAPLSPDSGSGIQAQCLLPHRARFSIVPRTHLTVCVLRWLAKIGPLISVPKQERTALWKVWAAHAQRQVLSNMIHVPTQQHSAIQCPAFHRAVRCQLGQWKDTQVANVEDVSLQHQRNHPAANLRQKKNAPLPTR